MKFRKCFVSNSSSTSFICEVCHESVSGWDMCLSEAEMVECRRSGHLFCEEHLIQPLFIDVFQNYDLPVEERYKETKVPDGEHPSDIENDWRYQVSAKSCPLCQLHHINDSAMLDYVLRKDGLTKEEVKNDIFNKFDTIQDMYDAIKGK